VFVAFSVFRRPTRAREAGFSFLSRSRALEVDNDAEWNGGGSLRGLCIEVLADARTCWALLCLLRIGKVRDFAVVVDFSRDRRSLSEGSGGPAFWVSCFGGRARARSRTVSSSAGGE